MNEMQFLAEGRIFETFTPFGNEDAAAILYNELVVNKDAALPSVGNEMTQLQKPGVNDETEAP